MNLWSMAESTCGEARETIEQWLVTYSMNHLLVSETNFGEEGP